MPQRTAGTPRWRQKRIGEAEPRLRLRQDALHLRFDRKGLFALMRERGFVIFRGSLTPFPTLRIGCMGAFDQTAMREVVRAIEASLAAMGVTDCQPAARPVAAE